ncbi:MAG: heme transporter ATP-binding protein [Akkermansiaceae bacterium]|nr:heme transporter ATP-binding protein [Akkermansiaceae bacterium]
MMSTLPKLTLRAGLAVGYDQPLASLPEDVTLAGGTHFLLARNGRGKTTLLRTVARTLKALKGSFEAQGRIQFLPEDLKFDTEIPVQSIFKAMIPKAARQAALELAGKIELDVKKPYGKLSTGNRRKTNLIVTEFSTDPAGANILLLDEPFSGLDAYAREIFEDLWVRSSGTIMRLVSCHPDYDSMGMPSALIIHGGSIVHATGSTQTWNQLKQQLN